MNTNEELCNLAASCWFVTGATAGGKTTLGIELARVLNGEIIALDSMTVYRDMDVGTAKPSRGQLAKCPHHLLDVCDPSELFSVSMYRTLAIRAIKEIRERGRTPIFVGGTALYLKVMLRGMFEGPPADWEFRAQVEQEVDAVGIESLLQRLQQIDPVAAHKLHPTDRRRIIRALEVKKITGRPISHWQREFDTGRDANDCRVFAIRHPRPELHRRIEERVRWMISNGLVGEVRELLTKYRRLHKTASQAVGYREAIDHLAGNMSIEDLFERILVRTRRFARHQETWFRGLSECRMIDVAEGTSTQQLVEQILEQGESARPTH